MQEGGEISILTAKTLHDATVSVKDSGSGVPKRLKIKYSIHFSPLKRSVKEQVLDYQFPTGLSRNMAGPSKSRAR